MKLEERIEANAVKGYIYVATIDGEDVWKKFDGIATVYYLDEGYEEILPIWNTTRSKHLLRTIYEDQETVNTAS
jgi:hypothetical protein